ncbi:hypothetical protein ACI2I3_00810 [Psychrobacter namhaensis]|uniref:Uncharacterized protein n=1 Tax=Psychrobacter namhaensis TaxID=292734 RepID=A0ABW8L4R5_9GAMM
MSQYTHRMTLVVPELLIAQANQLALIAGESVDDVNTFTQTSYQDKEGNLYAVCSTVIKPIVLSLLDTPLSDSPLQAKGADLVSAQQAMDKVVMYAEGVTATPDSIYIAIDYDPFEFFESLGLTAIETEEI